MDISIGGVDISNILNSKGTIVKCVLLHALSPSTTTEEGSSPPDDLLRETCVETKKVQDEPDSKEDIPTKDASPSSRSPSYKLAHMVSQISINTSPKERAVEKTLGGPFTFIGQYEDLGIIAMALRPTDNNNSDKPPLNKHVLQPPLHKIDGILGDILLMKVRSNEEDETTEFFLDLTRDEYLEFAARTDIVATNAPETGNEDDEMESVGSESESEEDEEFDEASDDEDDEVEEAEMFNVILGHIVQRFEQQNGRPPNATELLQMRTALAQKLGENVALVSDEEDEEGKEASKVNK